VCAYSRTLTTSVCQKLDRSPAPFRTLKQPFRSATVPFCNDTATPETYPLSLHDALPICRPRRGTGPEAHFQGTVGGLRVRLQARSEEHTSELQSRENLVCRLLLEKKKLKETHIPTRAVDKPARHLDIPTRPVPHRTTGPW